MLLPCIRSRILSIRTAVYTTPGIWEVYIYVTRMFFFVLVFPSHLYVSPMKYVFFSFPVYDLIIVVTIKYTSRKSLLRSGVTTYRI